MPIFRLCHYLRVIFNILVCSRFSHTWLINEWVFFFQLCSVSVFVSESNRTTVVLQFDSIDKIFGQLAERRRNPTPPL